MTEPLEYYAAQGAALFPIPAGKKAPGAIVESFKDHASRDPAQWAKWREENPGCNFGVVAFASQWITLDTDIKPIEGQTPEAARAEAWAMRGDLFKSWGMDPDTLPHVQSAHGGWHDHFAVPADIDAATLRQPDAIKGRINVRVKGYTVAAGSYYDGSEKNDAPGHYQLFANAAAAHPAPSALIEHCRRAERVATTRAPGAHDRGDVGNLVTWLDHRGGFEAYEDWCSLGMALKLECGDDAKELWALSHNETVTPDVIESKWESFASEPTDNSVTLNSFMKRAHQLGWTGSIRPSVGSMFAGVAQLASSPSIAPSAPSPFNMEGIPGPSNPAAEEESDFPFIEPVYPEQNGDDWLPPDYIFDGILQRRYCYSLTAQTDTGKTNVALRIAAHVATGTKLAGIDVEQGWVLYFAGENPEDVKGRWFALCREMGVDHKKIPVIFVYGTTHFSKTIQRYHRYLEGRGTKLSLAIVDTAAAYFEEDNDNDNVQAGNHARVLRSLRYLPGSPCVLVLCHPTKGAKLLADMTPRGGGAFLNEVDGNIGLARDDGGTIVAAKVGKFRGSEFSPLHFTLKVIKDHPMLVDVKGKQQTTVIAMPISNAEVARREETASRAEDKVLEALCNEPGISAAKVARIVGWGEDGKKASRALAKLADEKLAECVRGRWVATSKGQKSLNMAANAAAQPVQALAPLTPANLAPGEFPHPTRPVTPPPMPPPPG
jgi:hypothetical protein